MTLTVRRARTADVVAIAGLLTPYVENRILLGKERVDLYEQVQEFRVAADASGQLVGCGAVHVMWEDLAEVRSLAVNAASRGQGVGGAVLQGLISDARELGISRLFCLTFEVEFFSRFGFLPVTDDLVDDEVFAQLIRSHDEGVAEFLDLARVKPNTLGNTRMLLNL
jgi:amino-acid N-acetyltransferase